ncbi:MAG: hypothetical protein LBL90_09705 [Prevotellaceae bacterium]|jgi:hypothetical protein|nr:hypothetical protein [Prevotellaceae bacterium]
MKRANFKQKRHNGTTLKMLLLLVAIFGMSQMMRAQVTIGTGHSPHSDALLDLKENSGGTAAKGLLLPRVSLEAEDSPTPMVNHVAGMIVYNNGTSDPSTVLPENRVSPGFYYNTGARWERLRLEVANWFYMPSIAIDVTTTGTFTRDLYLEYRKQLEDVLDSSTPAESPIPGTTLVKSPGAPNPFTKIYEADKLYYYITGYDASVFSSLSITADGKLTYTVDANNVTDATYMNIVFVEK